MAERFYCVDGNVVYVTYDSNPDFITVNFRGQQYKKPSSIIGVKLFKYNPKTCNQNKKHDMNRDIADICNENAAKNANIVPTPDTASVGKTVLVYNTDCGRFEQYKICCSSDDREYGHVGSSRFSAGINADRTAYEQNGVMIVSDLSPIGNALMGCEKGQKVSISLPDRKKLNFIVRDIMG